MKSKSPWKYKLPWEMVIARAALAPVVVLISRVRPSGRFLPSCVVFALRSDIFDGILDRRWKVATGLLRRCDTIADTIFYAGVILVVLLRYPATVSRVWPLLLAVVALELAQHLFFIVKFPRLSRYHLRASKIWGLPLATGISPLLGFSLGK